MHIDLDDEQAEILRTVLDTALRELSYEIASADLPSFRLMLRRRREELRPILDALGGPIPAAERFSPATFAPATIRIKASDDGNDPRNEDSARVLPSSRSRTRMRC